LDRINLIIADSDQNYLAKLSDYIIENVPELISVSCCTSAQSLLNVYKREMDKISIVLVNKEILLELESTVNNQTELRDVLTTALIIMLDEENSDPVSNSVLCGGSVFKYSHGSRIISGLINQYTRITGKGSLFIRHNSASKVAAVFSAAGGIGKSTFAASIGIRCSKMGKSVLFVSLEEESSAAHFFGIGNGNNLSSVLYALKDKNISLDTALLSASANTLIKDMYFIPPPDSALEYDELNEDEIIKLIRYLKNQNKYQIVVIDLGNGIRRLSSLIIRECDLGFLLLGSCMVHRAKQILLEKELRLLGLNKGGAAKLIPVECRFGLNGKGTSEINFMGARVEDFLPANPLLNENDNIDALVSDISSYAIKVAELAARHLLSQSSMEETSAELKTAEN
jgi:Mrp family chromosome partitioning ATPase